ncbi:MAG: methyltransferase domain-containing protein [Saprospiraceae bacterium]
MSVEEFFNHFLEELKTREKLREYYKFIDDPAKLAFRKAYFCQRLQYIHHNLQFFNPSTLQSLKIWDVGCGYATTQIFLAINGIPSRGSTLEFYFKEIPERLRYWEQFGDMNLLKVSYENIFEAEVAENSEDVILVQDTLHHLEPLQESLHIFRRALRPGGMLLAIEENGNNILQRMKLYRYRGNRRIIEYFDEGLGRMVMMGNENIRPYALWKKELSAAGFTTDDERLQYIRLLPPSFFSKNSAAAMIEKEQALWKKYPFLREYFFFGINFIARKPR